MGTSDDIDVSSLMNVAQLEAASIRRLPHALSEFIGSGSEDDMSLRANVDGYLR
jgi:hypothetical protein